MTPTPTPPAIDLTRFGERGAWVIFRLEPKEVGPELTLGMHE